MPLWPQWLTLKKKPVPLQVPVIDPKKRAKVDDGDSRRNWIILRQSLCPGVDQAFFGCEYDNLANDPRIAALAVDNWSVRFKTVPVAVMLKDMATIQTVYLGTYKVILGLVWRKQNRARRVDDDIFFDVGCLHSGRYNGDLAHRYYLDSGPGHFCFGHKGNEFVKQLLAAGELFTIVNMTLDSLWKTNPGDVSLVIKEFRKVLPDLTPEPYKKLPLNTFSNLPPAPLMGYENELIEYLRR